jgi:hypothetical protein
MKSPTSIMKMLKSLTAREIFQRHPEVKKILWGGAFWSSGYFVNTVSKFGDEKTISKYVRNQGMEKDYNILHKYLMLEKFCYNRQVVKFVSFLFSNVINRQKKYFTMRIKSAIYYS